MIAILGTVIAILVGAFVVAVGGWFLWLLLTLWRDG